MALADSVSPPVAPTRPGYPVNLVVEYPEHLNRWLVLVKWLLIIPHGIVLMFLGVGQFASLFCAWWAILITGR
jgi:hypothetical protein